MVSDAAVLVEPAYGNFPPYEFTYGPEVADVCDLAGYTPDPEQLLALDNIFGVAASGLPSCNDFVIIAPRQNLKTGLEKQAALGWVFVTEEQLIAWTSHTRMSAMEAFRDLVHLIENTPVLAKRVDRVFTATGNESIRFKPRRPGAEPQRLVFATRTSSGDNLRGFSVDKVVLDEGYALTEDIMGGFRPTMSTRPNGQMVIGSSAAHVDSLVLHSYIERGRSDDVSVRSRLGYMEYCAPQGLCKMDGCTHKVGTPGCSMDDRSLWQVANSQAGRRISWEYLQSERESLPPEQFGRDRLGWHDSLESRW